MVNENYVVRFRSDVLYLLDFERHVKEQFSVAAPVYAKGALQLGITDEEVFKMASDDENIQAYVYDGQLFTSNEKDNSLSLIYTYQDGAEDKSFLDGYKLQPIRVETAAIFILWHMVITAEEIMRDRLASASFIINVRQPVLMKSSIFQLHSRKRSL